MAARLLGASDSSGEHLVQFLGASLTMVGVGVAAFVYVASDPKLVPKKTAVLVATGAYAMCAIVVVAPFDAALTLNARWADVDAARVDHFEDRSKVLQTTSLSPRGCL